MQEYYVYAARSLKYKYVYIGHTNCPYRRIGQHNNGSTPSIRGKLPLELFYTEKFSSRKEAVEREKELKKSHNREWLRKIAYPGGVAECSMRHQISDLACRISPPYP
ncbi:GIY-YIG nuclease family protein [Patescibacteria group bacterium]|nr:GIY-YIG nuclease family protein [Patescibacteria group bacterium]